MASRTVSARRVAAELLACAAAILMLLAAKAACQATIHNVSLGTGSDRNLALARLSTGELGTLCLLNDWTNIGDAFCTAALSRPHASAAKIFNGSTSDKVVAAIQGCPNYKPDQSNTWDLNIGCNIITGPNIPATCQSGGRRNLEVQCQEVALRHGRISNEGLVLAGLTGSLGTICASGVGVREAIAVCRTLGFPNPERGFPMIGRYKANDTNPEENVTIEGLRCGSSQTLSSCTWRPVATPDCFHESNRLSVSCSAVDVTPRPLPSPSLICYRQQARICFHSASLMNSSDLQLERQLEPTLCNSSFQVNASHVCLQVLTYAQCAAYFDSVANQYELAVRFNGEKDSSGNYIRPPLLFTLYCVVSRESLATGPSLAPEFATPTTARDGHAGGEAVIQLYRDMTGGDFTNPVRGSVQVGTVLYAAVFLQRATDSSWLVVNNCWASDGQHNASLVSNRCPAKSDVVVIPVNATAMAVRFQAFLFANLSSGTTMSLVCSTIVCRVGDPSSECNRLCTTFSAAADVNRLLELTTKPASLTVHATTPPIGNSERLWSMAPLTLATLALSSVLRVR